MEAFSLLRYWRGGGGRGSGRGPGGIFPGDATRCADSGSSATTATTILTAVSPRSSESDDDNNDEGPFFDLEFAVPDEDDDDIEEQEKNKGDEGERRRQDDADEHDVHPDDEDCSDSDASDNENDGELKFTLSSGSSGDRTDPHVSLSPSDDLLFNGRLVPIEPSSLLLTAAEANSKFPVSLLKSATKFRVLMLKFKKSKSAETGQKAESSAEPLAADKSVSATPQPLHKQSSETVKEQECRNRTQSKLFTVKFKVEEVPIVSLFTRDNSSKGNANSRTQKRNVEDSDSNANAASSDEKKFSKEMVQRYLKMVKPLYVRVSKRYGEKLKLSGQVNLSGGATKTDHSQPPSAVEKEETRAPEAAEAPALDNAKNQKPGSLPAGLRVVRKHLAKSRSASSAVAAAPSAPSTSKRRDDSLLQQQDGIQGAILHCKRSFNSSRDSDPLILSRSTSDPSHEKGSTFSPMGRTSSSEKTEKEMLQSKLKSCQFTN